MGSVCKLNIVGREDAHKWHTLRFVKYLSAAGVVMLKLLTILPLADWPSSDPRSKDSENNAYSPRHPSVSNDEIHLRLLSSAAREKCLASTSAISPGSYPFRILCDPLDSEDRDARLHSLCATRYALRCLSAGRIPLHQVSLLLVTLASSLWSNP